VENPFIFQYSSAVITFGEFRESEFFGIRQLKFIRFNSHLHLLCRIPPTYAFEPIILTEITDNPVQLAPGKMADFDPIDAASPEDQRNKHLIRAL